MGKIKKDIKKDISNEPELVIKKPIIKIQNTKEIYCEIEKADENTYLNYNNIEDINKLRLEFKDRLKEFEKTELKKPNWQQHREYTTMITRLHQHLRWMSIRISDIKQNKKKIDKKSEINKKAIKQANLVRLIKEGKSLTTIVSTPEGISKKEISEIITNEIADECTKYRKDFHEYWKRWKEKNL